MYLIIFFFCFSDVVAINMGRVLRLLSQPCLPSMQRRRTERRCRRESVLSCVRKMGGRKMGYQAFFVSIFRQKRDYNACRESISHMSKSNVEEWRDRWHYTDVNCKYVKISSLPFTGEECCGEMLCVQQPRCKIHPGIHYSQSLLQ